VSLTGVKFRERWPVGIFTHVAALPWGMNDDMLIMHFPAGRPGEKGVYCVR
jgi:hypothetical protein